MRHGLSSAPIPGVSLDAAGLITLAELDMINRRTALVGSTNVIDALIICPGLQCQQDAPNLNGGEYPACAAMTTGFVFRIENQATVAFLQKVGVTGHLVVMEVGTSQAHKKVGWRQRGGDSITSLLFYLAPMAMTGAALAFVIALEDWWALAVLLILVFARFLNIFVIRRRAEVGWHGAAEPGVSADLLILLSQDRWIRMKGLVDDVKAVTSGQWLRDPAPMDSLLEGLAKLLIYFNVVTASNATQAGNIVLIVLLFLSAISLGVSNEVRETLQMHGRLVRVVGRAKKYARRLDLARDLIAQTKRDDWAVQLGMINPADAASSPGTFRRPTM